tara:strand:- start:233 stop:388 length:156 start_codon:yes stop_codon:yes gene_type:complete
MKEEEYAIKKINYLEEQNLNLKEENVDLRIENTILKKKCETKHLNQEMGFE